MNIKYLFLTFVLFAFSQSAHAVPQTFSLTGNLNSPSAFQLFEFDVQAILRPRDVTFETFASDGGINAAGQVFDPPRDVMILGGIEPQSDGFEPYLFLYGTDDMLFPLGIFNPMRKGETDVIETTGFFPGTYTLALSNGALPNSDNLADGLSGGGGSSFSRGPLINNGPLWAIDFVGVEDVRALPGGSTDITTVILPIVADVPEPSAFLLMGIGLIGLVGIRKKKTV